MCPVSKTSAVCAGGLRLQPASPALWAALGNTEATPAAQEQCLHRALQLDPRDAGAWTALGRLYAEKGHGAQADACLMQARSHDPDAPAPWEAMGAMAGASATGTCCLSAACPVASRTLPRPPCGPVYSRKDCMRGCLQFDMHQYRPDADRP